MDLEIQVNSGMYIFIRRQFVIIIRFAKSFWTQRKGNIPLIVLRLAGLSAQALLYRLPGQPYLKCVLPPALEKHPPDCSRLPFYHLPPVLSCQG